MKISKTAIQNQRDYLSARKCFIRKEVLYAEAEGNKLVWVFSSPNGLDQYWSGHSHCFPGQGWIMVTIFHCSGIPSKLSSSVPCPGNESPSLFCCQSAPMDV